MEETGKSRQGATSEYRPHEEVSPAQLFFSDSEDDPEKENQYSEGKEYRNKVLIESSDDDFDQCEWTDYSIFFKCNLNNVTQVA